MTEKILNDYLSDRLSQSEVEEWIQNESPNTKIDSSVSPDDFVDYFIENLHVSLIWIVKNDSTKPKNVVSNSNTISPDVKKVRNSFEEICCKLSKLLRMRHHFHLWKKPRKLIQMPSNSCELEE